MPFPPDVYLIGAPKAGTTTLAGILGAHPRITLSSPKEPHYFTQNWSRGLDWYRECFAGSEDGIFLDASTSYSSDPLGAIEGSSPLAGVPERIYRLNPDARFIYLVREPVARTYSAYWHDVRLGYEDLPFWEAIAADPMYLATSDYAGQVKKYLQYFQLGSFLIMPFENLLEDRFFVADQCFKFIGVEGIPRQEMPDLHKNRSYTYNGFGRSIYSLFSNDRNLKKASDLAKRLIPEPAYQALGRLLTKEIPPMEESHRKALEEYFAPKNKELRNITGVETGYEERGRGEQGSIGLNGQGGIRAEE